MPVYKYKAVDQNGIMVQSKIQEKSKQNLVNRLKANGLVPIEIIQTSLGNFQNTKKNTTNIQELMKIASESDVSKSGTGRKVSISERIRLRLNTQQTITNRDLEIFTQNFYLLKKAGFNNVHALSTIVESTENASLKGIVEDILSGVEAGDYMYTTMEYYSNIFPYIYINLIKVGELSGSLDESLKQAIEYLESSFELTKKLKHILIPNIAQFLLLLVTIIVGSLYVVPIIQGVFEAVGSTETLPWYTIAFSDFLNSVKGVWYIPLLIIAAIVGVIFLRIQTPKGKYKWDYFKYTMPVFGKLIFAIDFSRLSEAMLLNLKNGMRIQESLEISKNVVKNYVMLSIIESAINNITVGKSWVMPFEESGLPNHMVTEMLKIGMQTNLSEMMDKLVEYMKYDVEINLQRIIKVLPQILYVIVGIMIIFITIVVLVPCIQVYMGTFLFSAAGF